MKEKLSVPEIESKILSAKEEFNSYCSNLTNEAFFNQPENKWSPAQQVKHLIKATNMARLAFILPKFIVRIVGGKPNRNSRTYDELVAKYKLKLEQGGKASGRYIPKPIPVSYGKEKLLNQFSKAMEGFASSLKNKWKEPLPDNYIAPHPLLGKITLRELCYFTIHHTHHHLESIQKIIISK